jgi:hypothetical protein
MDERVKPTIKDCKNMEKKIGGNFCSPIKLFSKKFDQKNGAGRKNLC